MNDTIQFIEQDGKPAFAVVPIGLWRMLAERLEDADDVAAYDREKAAEDGARIPLAVVQATLLDDVHPVRAWREHRGMTQAALATAVGVSRAFICQIEAGERIGSVDTLAAIARTLGVSLDLLAPVKSEGDKKGPVA